MPSVSDLHKVRSFTSTDQESNLHRVLSLTSADHNLSLHHAYSRDLSRVVSYAQMKEANAIPDVSFKILMVGDPGIGKTKLWHTYIDPQKKLQDSDSDDNDVVDDEEKYASENHVITIDDESGKTVQLALWDTINSESADRMRPLSYSNSDIVILAYSSNDRASFNNIRKKWMREVKHFAPKSHRLLLGTKMDIKDTIQDIITDEEIDEMSKRIGAFDYLTCSANENLNITELLNIILDKLLQDGTIRSKKYNQPDLLKTKLEMLKKTQSANTIGSNLNTSAKLLEVPKKKKKKRNISGISKDIKPKESCIIVRHYWDCCHLK
ncbi:hypothetical protein C6P45_000187 [Maudiozyma exigua]|uniref:Uncharacterized protein n=1 Tax=Maudiozyma exigua TaxID=34358 RepID=A0A9P6W8A7_MAUEX|nr:hypothetical protein C6P45_000187 [Kazachstania exigua]